MSPSELDLPLVPSAEQIRRKEFATVRRGYDLDQVREYLTQIALQVETLEKDLRDTKLSTSTRIARTPSPGEALAEQVAREDASKPATPKADATGDPYDRLAARVSSLIRAADQEATRLTEEAKAEATRVLDEARTEADRIRVDAQARAEEARQAGRVALEKAKAEADRTVGTLAERRETLVEQMHEMQARLLSVAKDLEVSIEVRDATVATIADEDAPTEDDARTEDDDRIKDTDAGAQSADGGAPAAKAKASLGFGEDVLDPRYDDLWVSKETAVDIPDLASIELDFDEDDTKG